MDTNQPQPQPYARPQLHQRHRSSSTKLSFRSHSSSFEADDERSSSGDEDNMGPDGGSRSRPPPQYDGEDTRLTSQKELAGWYAYGFAAEVFVICGMGSFIPITLEQLARENGVLLSDRTTPCGSSSTPHTLMKDNGQCIVYILGMEINTASFAMYTFSISVLVQSILVISISCAADHGNYRKRLLLFLAWTGALATMLFLPVVPKVYLFGALLAIISNTCFGASFVLLNSFLPLLVRYHPKIQEVDTSSAVDEDEHLTERTSETDATMVNTTTPLLPPNSNPGSLTPTSIELQLSTKISSTGIGIGYCAGLFVQCLSVVILLALKSSTFSLRLVLFIIGAWWFIFTIPAAMWLRPRPGPPLPSHSERTWVRYIIHAWSSLFRTISLTPQLPDILLFLLAWFLLSDAIATVSGVAILFAKTQLHMPPAALALISVTATTSGILGAFTWPILSRALRLTPTSTIIACISLFEVIPVYGLLGYIPLVRSWGVIGLQQPWEMYPLALLYGFVLGGFSSYCRSLFGELIPPGSEAAFYALYAITDKGSSIFGPAIVGMIVDRTGEIRPAFWFLVVLVGLPAPLIWCVDVDRGKEAGTRLKDAIEGFVAGQSWRVDDERNRVNGDERVLLEEGEEEEEEDEDDNDDVRTSPDGRETH